MQIKHRIRCVRKIVFLLLYCTLNLNISFTYARSADETVKLSDDVEVRRLAEGIWLHTTYFDIDGLENVPANGLIVIDGKDAMMIDLPWTDKQTSLLFDWVTKEHQAVVQRVVPTHSHIDCAGGLAEAHRRKAESFALDKTVEILKRTKKTIPKNWFTDRLCLGCGDIDVELAFLGAGHTIDNIVAWIPKREILFGGCMLYGKVAKRKESW